MSPRRDILFDLSPVLRPETPVWPGDTPFSRRPIWSLNAGDTVNLSSITTTPHLGAHADAPLHTEPDGISIAQMPLDAYVGTCRVLDVSSPERGADDLLEPDELPPLDAEATPRILFRTGSVLDRQRFPRTFTALSPRLAQHLADLGVRLVGIDGPSVDPFSSQNLPAHHALLGRGIAVLEGLMLENVPAGIYELVALPLPLEGLDASPVRAVLRALSGD